MGPDGSGGSVLSESRRLVSFLDELRNFFWLSFLLGFLLNVGITTSTGWERGSRIRLWVVWFLAGAIFSSSALFFLRRKGQKAIPCPKRLLIDSSPPLGHHPLRHQHADVAKMSFFYLIQVAQDNVERKAVEHEIRVTCRSGDGPGSWWLSYVTSLGQTLTT